MIYKTQEIIRAVREVMDINREDEQLLAERDFDTLDINDVIESKIEDAAKSIVEEADLSDLEAGNDIITGGGEIFIEETGNGFVVLPEDFLRLQCFKMSDWDKAVFQPIAVTSAAYARQKSPHKGVRGNYHNPIVAIVNRAEGKCLEFYSCKDNHATIVQADYQPIPRIKSGAIEINRPIYRATIYRTAALAMMTIGDPNTSAIMQMSMAMLGIHDKPILNNTTDQ